MSRARTPMIDRPAAFVLSAAIVVTTALASCGAPTPPPRAATGAAVVPPDTRADAAPLLTDVITKIDQQGSASSDVHGDLGLVGELTGAGAIRYEDGHADIALGGHTQAAQGQPPQRVEVTVADNIGYLKSPLLLPEGGKPWLRIAPDGVDFAAKLLSPALRQLRDSADPRTTFAGIEPATKIQSSAPDQVDGRPATRYELRALTGRAAQIAPDERQRTRFRNASDAGIPELGYQLWVDEAGLPVRFAATQNVAQAGKVSLTSTYRDWGRPVEIQPPPADRIGVFRDFPAPQAQQPPQ